MKPTSSHHKRKLPCLNAPNANGIDYAQLVNDLLKKDVELIEAPK